ncbi:MAG: ATP-dependent Clp protease proteolytic subunit [Planctomycetota bacterium]|nr:ATP-dependent Clp protease proteolytic subunit [Planctomycetota bacterium]
MADRFAPSKARLDDDDDDGEGDGCGAEKQNKVGPEMLGRRLLEKRVVMVTKPVDRDLMSAIVAQLLVLDADSHDPITMYINCPGGDADSGFGIYDAMKFIESPVTTVCMGLAASAAIIIFLGGEKGRRFSMPNSRFLIHQPSSQAQGQASDLEITAKEILKTRDKYNDIIAAETGVAAKAIVKDAHRDFWLSAKEAVEYKLADKLVVKASEL